MKSIDWETSRGVTVRLIPFPPELLSAIMAKIEWPEPPTYEHEILGGVKEVLPHTVDTLETDEEKAAWKAYEARLNETINHVYQKKFKSFLRRSVLIDLPQDDTWIRLQKEDDVEVPDDVLERKRHYLLTEAIGSFTDVVMIVDIIDRLSRFDQEDLKSARDLFRRQMEGEAAA